VLAAVLEGSGEAVLALDADLGVLVANPAAEEWFSREESAGVGTAPVSGLRASSVGGRLVGQSFAALVGERLPNGARLVAAVTRAMAARETQTLEHLAWDERTLEVRIVPLRDAERRRPQRRRDTEHQSRPANGVVILAQDVSRGERLRTELLQSARLAALGSLVGGVAHEINNPLAGLIGYVELLLGGSLPDGVRQDLLKVRLEADRCRRVVENLMLFARPHRPRRETVDLNALVRETVALLAYELRAANIVIREDLAPDAGELVADPHQLRQVLFNLVNHARQAMKAGGGTLTLRTARAGSLVRLWVSDTGPGIPDDHLGRVFDPFFTTRDAEPGNLGLSICYGLVKEHGGRIAAGSESGRGATFVVELPVAGAAERAPAEAAVVSAAGSARLRLRAPAALRVLIVDDEPVVVEVLEEILRHEGHSVSAAADGPAALRCLAHARFDLVLCDLRLPGMDGRQVYETVRRRWPPIAQRFAFTTGQIVTRETLAFLRGTGRPFLAKPFSASELRGLLAAIAAPGA
jgi:two-component system NtrC family sensor kinase